LKIVLRGHKQYCPYQSCSCEKCRFTAEQQRQMRLQNAIRRAEAQERGGGTGRGRGRPAQSTLANSNSQNQAENQQVQQVQAQQQQVQVQQAQQQQQQQQQQQPRQATPGQIGIDFEMLTIFLLYFFLCNHNTGRCTLKNK
jgi:cobalamin biosynthesis Mg chelatase CobN